MGVQLSSNHPNKPSSLRILVADDNDVLRVAVQGLLRNLGHTVKAVINGREAVELAAREDFDLVFLDMQMPEMGGLEAAHMLRRDHDEEHRSHIIGLSAQAEENALYAAAGMDDFLVKPVRLDDLVRVTKQYASS